jgi:hypothetical protein
VCVCVRARARACECVVHVFASKAILGAGYEDRIEV